MSLLVFREKGEVASDQCRVASGGLGFWGRGFTAKARRSQRVAKLGLRGCFYRELRGVRQVGFWILKCGRWE